MTEGIIQEVFKKYSVMNEPIVWLLDKIEQELIEKIKQEQQALLDSIRGEIEAEAEGGLWTPFKVVRLDDVLAIIDKHLNQSKERGSK